MAAAGMTGSGPYRRLVVERRGPVGWIVNGICAGGGLHWLADGDVVLAAADATFVDPHVSIGQVSAFEVIGLARRAPFEAVMRMALVGRHERLPARRAYELGLVSQVVDPPEGLHAAAQAVALRVASGDAAQLAARKTALWQAQETAPPTAVPGR